MILAAPAAAAINSNVSVPADGSHLSLDLGAPSPSVHVEGTSDLPDATPVDIGCYFGSQRVKLGQLTTHADGSFSGDLPVSISFTGRTCVLRAIAHDDATSYPPGITTTQTGPRVTIGHIQPFFISGTSGPTYDFSAFDPQFEGQFEWRSLGDCMVYFSYVLDPVTLAQSHSLFECNAWLGDNDRGQTTPASRSELQVGGADAYPPYSAHGLDGPPSGLPAITGPTRSFDPATGDDTLSWSEPIVKCAPGGYPPTTANCPDVVGTGVRADVTVHQDHAGRAGRVIIRFVSTDGNAHAIDALFDQEDDHAPNKGVAEFPWTGAGFQAYNEGDSVPAPPPGTSGTVFAKFNKDLPNGDVGAPMGAITFANGPDGIRWLFSTSGFADRWVMHYARTVPAGGSTTFGWVFSQSFDQGQLNALASEAQASFTPSIAIDGPVGGTVSTQPQVLVTGTAADPTTPFTVDVNGVAATVQGDGSWSATVPLAAGANTLRATVTNQFGTTAADQRSVTYQPPFAPPAATFAGVHVVRLVYTLDRHGRIVVLVSCPAGASGRCVGRLTLTTIKKFLLRIGFAQDARKKKPKRVQVGSSAFSIAAGKTGKVRVKISTRARKLVTSRRKLAVALAMKSHDASGVSRSASARITVKAPKRKKGHGK
jgi:hypothetical protein